MIHNVDAALANFRATTTLKDRCIIKLPEGVDTIQWTANDGSIMESEAKVQIIDLTYLVHNIEDVARAYGSPAVES